MEEWLERIVESAGEYRASVPLIEKPGTDYADMPSDTNARRMASGEQRNNPAMADPISRPEIDAKFDAIRSDMRADAASLRTEMASLHGDLRAGMESLRADFHKTGTASARWLLATAIGMVVGFGGLFLTMSNTLKPQAAAQPPVQVIVPQPPAPAASK